MARGAKKPRRNFGTTSRSNIPTGRKGKHSLIVAQILSDLQQLESGESLKIPISELPDSIVNIRSALSRATRKLHRPVATATDGGFLYVWNS